MGKLALALLAGLCVAGCSTPSPNAVAQNDPYEATNRSIFEFNQRIDRHTLRPSAEHYAATVPEGVRDSIHNALENLDLPVTFVNEVLQGEPRLAGRTVGRFALNSTFGFASLFDVATRLGIEEHTEDFGQTLAVWGIGDGPYLMLPFLGPSSPRDATGFAVDFAFDPTIYVRVKHHYWWIIGRKYISMVDQRARRLDTLDDIERNSLDFYATTRSLYRQYRANEIRNGAPQPDATNLP